MLLRRAVLCCATGPAHVGLYRGWLPAAPFIITLNTPAGLRGRDRLRCVVSENILQPAMGWNWLAGCTTCGPPPTMLACLQLAWAPLSNLAHLGTAFQLGANASRCCRQPGRALVDVHYPFGTALSYGLCGYCLTNSVTAALLWPPQFWGLPHGV